MNLIRQNKHSQITEGFGQFHKMRGYIIDISSSGKVRAEKRIITTAAILIALSVAILVLLFFL